MECPRPLLITAHSAWVMAQFSAQAGAGAQLLYQVLHGSHSLSHMKALAAPSCWCWTGLVTVGYPSLKPDAPYLWPADKNCRLS